MRFTYPGRDAPVFDGLDLTIEAGRSLAIVGLNGAGKTTLVKLLVGLEIPERGRITVDGVDLASLDPVEWRRRTSAGFQDHARFEFLARETIGIGRLDAMEDESEVISALERAGAADLPGALPQGLATQLGPSWPRWRRPIRRAVAEARDRSGDDETRASTPPAGRADGFPRRRHRAQAVRALDCRRALASEGTGGVTVLVSHRFSTVRMAGLIVVLDKGGIAEVGSHAELIARGGLYAELFEIQAQSYR